MILKIDENKTPTLDKNELNNLGSEDEEQDIMPYNRNEPINSPTFPEIFELSINGFEIKIGSHILRADALAQIGLEVYNEIIKLNNHKKKDLNYIG